MVGYVAQIVNADHYQYYIECQNNEMCWGFSLKEVCGSGSFVKGILRHGGLLTCSMT